MRIRNLALAASLSAGLVLSACGSSDSDSDSDSTADGAAPTEAVTVSTMFGDVEIPAPEDGTLDVVALGWSDAEMALSLGVKPVAVYDWQAFGEENKGVGPWATELFGEDTPTVIAAGDQSINYEQIQGLNPDVILNVRAANVQEDFDKLSEIAPTIYAPEGTDPFATDWEVQLETVGQALSKTEEAGTVADDVNAAIEEAKQPEFEGVTVASGAKFGEAYGAYLAGDGRFDILADLGFVQNPPVEELESSGFFATVPAEKVDALDAEVAVILPIGFTLQETESDSLISSLDVVKDDRAVFLDPDSDLAGAWGASSSLSIPVVLDELGPQLQEAAAKVE